MRTSALLLALALAAPAHAAVPRLPTPAVAPAAPVDDAAARIEALQQRLAASQQAVVNLQRQLADEKARSAALEECRVRNGKLVFLGKAMIEAYGSRYQHEVRHDPMQLPRRRFEYELQTMRETVFDQRVDVPVKPPKLPSQPAPAEAH